jgi:hypothetical protein
MPKKAHPLAEVFGFPTDNLSLDAIRFRKNKLCPFNNKVPSCTKDKIQDPLGVCSVIDSNSNISITCPTRFREKWLIIEDAASFIFPKGEQWTSLTEVRLNDKNGKSAGNIDIVLVSYDDTGNILDFGALEIQGVYISGNIRNPFNHYMKSPEKNGNMDWSSKPNYPRPDYLSSSRKRLAPQLIYKGGILKYWQKKTCVAIDSSFHATLPELPKVEKKDADIAWLIYELQLNSSSNVYELHRKEVIYTKFSTALDIITTSLPGKVDDFISGLQEKLLKKLENNPIDNNSDIGIDDLMTD